MVGCLAHAHCSRSYGLFQGWLYRRFGGGSRCLAKVPTIWLGAPFVRTTDFTKRHPVRSESRHVTSHDDTAAPNRLQNVAPAPQSRGHQHSNSKWMLRNSQFANHTPTPTNNGTGIITHHHDVGPLQSTASSRRFFDASSLLLQNNNNNDNTAVVPCWWCRRCSKAKQIFYYRYSCVVPTRIRNDDTDADNSDQSSLD